MAKLIVTSRYLKSGTAKSMTKRKNYIKYIATRETVEIREQRSINQNAPASEKQQELLCALLADFPESKKYLLRSKIFLMRILILKQKKQMKLNLKFMIQPMKMKLMI